jgi:GTP 3',8-cyclase
MRCTYCRPTQLTECDRDGDLSADEVDTLVRHLVHNHGLHKVRLTGGDPTARPDLISIIERIARIEGIDDLAMTTNGLSLASHARDYAAAGLGRVNVSLDSLNRDTFEQMTGVDGLHRVLRGIDAAIGAGLTPLHLNTVVMRHHNEGQLIELVDFAASVGAEIRFIEMMPMGPMGDRWADHYVPEPEIRQQLQTAFTGWEQIPQHHDSARRYRVTTTHGRQAVVGFITPMSCNFCADCNRIRIAADGTIYPCLMDRPAGTLMPALRPAFDPDRLNTLIAEALEQKQPEHPLQGFVTMTHIGG